MTFYIVTQTEGRVYDTNIQRLRDILWNHMITDCLLSGDFGCVSAIYKDNGKIVQKVFFVILHDAVFPAYTICNSRMETFRSYYPIFRFDQPIEIRHIDNISERKTPKWTEMINILSLKDRQILCWNRG